MFRSLIAAVSLVLLAGCASTPAYGPAANGGAGFSERQIESNRFFVTYRAPGGADPQVLQDYALLRAADVTLLNGREWFWVDRRSLDDAPDRSGPSVGVGVGAGNWGRHTGVNVGVGVNIPLGAGGARARSATVEIRLGEGVKPDDPNAYDARATAANLRARLLAPR